MIAENVTLIVKAPNQQIEDQNIECQSSWTVGQLKGHLSEVYPSKPRTEEQKIIYSGQLLDDNIVLKDVLRTYESQLGHTMHLVCAPSKTMTTPTPPEESTDGLRQRTVPTDRPEATPRPEMRQNDQNHTVEMQNYLTSIVNNYGRVPPYPSYNMGEGYLPVPNDQTSVANHMVMMQQAYMRYLQHYANMWQATVNAAPAPAAEPPAAPPAAAPPADEDEAPDWLEHVYCASRLAALLSLVYLYGSPARLLLVLVITAAAYLHQIGFFRELFVNDDNNQNPNPNRAAQRNQQPQPQPNAQQPQPEPNPQQPLLNPPQPQQNPPQPQQNPPQPQPNPQQPQPNPPQPQPNLPQPQPNPPQPQTQPMPTRNQMEQNAPSFFAITWMVFTSFFTSLIPETNH